MPPAKRSTASSKSSSASKPAAKKSATAKTPAKSGGTQAATSSTKATATTARKSTARTATQAKAASTRTGNAASAGAARTTGAAKTGAKTTAKAAGAAVAETAKAATAGAKGTATAAKGGAKATTTQAKAANTRTKNASGGDGIVATAVKAVRPAESVTLTREKIQETLDDAAARGRVTRKDANELVAELMRHGHHAGEEVGELLGRGAKRLGGATKRVRKAEPVDRVIRGADRARRAAGVGPSFPILGYDDLNATQVQARVKELSKPEARKVLTYERKNANRKGVVTALEKQIG